MQTETRKNSGFDYQWLFGFAIVFGGFYLLTKPATNNKVVIFRLALVAVGAIGFLITTLIKRKRADIN